MFVQQNGQPRGPLEGAQFGPFWIDRLIGRGGMAVVYQARHLALDRIVALKLLLTSQAGDQELRERFLVEARAAARLDHPRIVPVYDCGEIDGISYISMKLLEGRDLREALQEQRREGNAGLPLRRAVNILSQAASALEYAHKHRVVHRDVKPGNVHLGADDSVTLLDFGIARALDLSSSTLAGTVLGTPMYMSPEQARGRPADSRSDIYSLGIVLYEMLSGALPFTGEMAAVLYAHVHSPPPPLDWVRPELPSGVTEVLLRALAKDPDQRFQHAADFGTALEDAAGSAIRSLDDTAGGSEELTLKPVAGPPDTRISQRRRQPPLAGVEADRVSRHFVSLSGLRGWPIAFAAVAVCVTGLVAWLFVSGLAMASGRLVVDSEPSGASVSVDGNFLGSTPLQARALSSGKHQVVLEKPTYLEVKRVEQIRRGQTDPVRVLLQPLPPVRLLDVKLATVKSFANLDASGRVSLGAEVNNVAPGETFSPTMSVAQKAPGVRDVSFRCRAELYDPSGNRQLATDPRTITIPKDDALEHGCSWNFTLPDSFVLGAYSVKFYIDDDEAAPPRVITLTK